MSSIDHINVAISMASNTKHPILPNANWSMNKWKRPFLLHVGCIYASIRSLVSVVVWSTFLLRLGWAIEKQPLWRCNYLSMPYYQWRIDTLKPRRIAPILQTTFAIAFLESNVWISFEISLKFVLKARINHIPALVQIMAWRRPGDKPLSGPMMVSLLTHRCVTRP